MKQRLTVFLGIGALVAWYFAPALGGTSGFAFRDAAHFYRPLFEYIREEWAAGRAPLWNPYENLGVPLVAQNTASVFYPGKLLFVLPVDYVLLYHLYIVLHLAVAAATSYALARHGRASPLAAGLAAISYAFSGTVLFAYSNVAFLVGAAWLPLAILAADSMLRLWSPAGAAGFGVVLALMITGGDPQMAYNAVLTALLLALLTWREERRAAIAAKPRWVSRRAVLLATSLAVAAALAAVQILPSLEAASRSTRAQYDAPRNIYELAAWSLAPGPADDANVSWCDGILGRLRDGHEAEVYHFSLAPWRVVELFWPNVTGRAFPTNGRWLGPLGVEPNVWDLWTPALYMGLLPWVLAATAWSIRRRAPLEVRFFSSMVVAGALASFGAYGAVSAVRFALAGKEIGVGSEVGGLYWWLVVLLPGYVYFRYPAKLFVLAALGLSILAARGWDELWERGNVAVRRWFGALSVLSLLGLAAVAIGWSTLEQFGRDSPPAPILGPFDRSGARRDVTSGLLQTAVLSLVFLAALRVASSRPAWARRLGVLAFVVTLADLAIAQKDLVLYAPEEAWQTPAKALTLLRGVERGVRVYRQPRLWPDAWQRTCALDRFTELVRWDRDTRLAKYPLPGRITLVDSPQTIDSADYQALLDAAASERGGSSILDLLGVQAAIVSGKAASQFSKAENLGAGALLGVRPNPLPRAWIVHRVDVFPELRERSPRRLRQRTEEVLYPDGRPRDWRREVVVETDQPIAIAPPARDLAAEESCRIVHADPLHVEIEAQLTADGLVVLADQFDPGWELTVETLGRSREQPILRANRVMRGAWLPPGRHRLVYRYRPQSFFYGAAISVFAAVALVAIAAYSALRHRQSGKEPSAKSENSPPAAAR